MNNIKVIHLIHAEVIGGVEVGAKLGQKDLNGKINYEIRYIFNPNDNFIIKIKKFFYTIIALIKENNSFVKDIQESDIRIIQEFNTESLINKFPVLKDRYLHPFLFNLDVRDEKKFLAIEKPVNMAASKHIGYAIQWFGLCIALIILTIYAFRRKDG